MVKGQQVDEDVGVDARFPNVTVIKSRAGNYLLTKLRDKSTNSKVRSIS